MTEQQDVFFELRNGLATITMNRPKILNALSYDMLMAISPRLHEWADDPAVKAVLIKGTGDKAFCAGGDIRSILEDKKVGGPLPEVFFREEYKVNRLIHNYPKPYIALIDGVTMGGGVGLSVHGSHRIATQHTMMAMPETAIGFFTDVGGSYFLPRLPGEIGVYMGLTGHPLRAADCLYTGVATHYVEAAKLPSLEDALLSADWDSSDAQGVVDDIVRRFADDPGRPPIGQERDAVDRCFSADTVELIQAALEAEGTEWASTQLGLLEKRAPLSLKVTLRALRQGATQSFDNCMVMEYRLSQSFMDGSDFFEGVRAVLVDKDHAPRWQPASLEAVSDAMVEDYFTPLGVRDLSFDG